MPAQGAALIVPISAKLPFERWLATADFQRISAEFVQKRVNGAPNNVVRMTKTTAKVVLNLVGSVPTNVATWPASPPSFVAPGNNRPTLFQDVRLLGRSANMSGTGQIDLSARDCLLQSCYQTLL